MSGGTTSAPVRGRRPAPAAVAARPFVAVLLLFLVVGVALYSGQVWTVPTIPWPATSYRPASTASPAATTAPTPEPAATAALLRRDDEPQLAAERSPPSSSGGVTLVRSAPVPPVGPGDRSAPPPPPIGAVLRVANTGGDGVFLRRTPRILDRLVAWPDATRVESLGETAEGDGLPWVKVRDPSGNLGWIPIRYVVAAAPRTRRGLASRP